MQDENNNPLSPEEVEDSLVIIDLHVDVIKSKVSIKPTQIFYQSSDSGNYLLIKGSGLSGALRIDLDKDNNRSRNPNRDQ